MGHLPEIATGQGYLETLCFVLFLEALYGSLWGVGKFKANNRNLDALAVWSLL